MKVIAFTPLHDAHEKIKNTCPLFAYTNNNVLVTKAEQSRAEQTQYAQQFLDFGAVPKNDK